MEQLLSCHDNMIEKHQTAYACFLCNKSVGCHETLLECLHLVGSMLSLHVTLCHSKNLNVILKRRDLTLTPCTTVEEEMQVKLEDFDQNSNGLF